MTMEQSRRLVALERRLEAMEATHIRDRDAIVQALDRHAEELAKLRRAVVELEREQVR